IKLFSYVGETVLDPFAGSGTTLKVARVLKRNSVGYEIIRDLENIIKKKIGFDGTISVTNTEDVFEIIERKTGKYRSVTLDFIEKRKNANVWENYVTIGSLQSVSLNLPRYAYISKSEDEYFDILDEKMELCARILLKKWKLMEKRLKSGHLPLCSGTIKGKPIFNIEDQNLSIGFTGLNEAVKS
ncbi:MAG: hypothetical protein HWN80_20635, partial [Candidatus Lokiarchaeota archaeon]|nr:hypothetical protein [Candidatus Lokiarchaeota archaeon]